MPDPPVAPWSRALLRVSAGHLPNDGVGGVGSLVVAGRGGDDRGVLDKLLRH